MKLSQYLNEKKIFNADDLIDDIMSIHRNPDDFEEGDIINRIRKFSPYILMNINIDELDLNEWDVQENLVDEFIKKYIVNKKYPPIIVGKEGAKPKPLLTGKDLIDVGLQPGPKFKEILNKVYDEQLEGKVTNREEALEMMRKMI